MGFRVPAEPAERAGRGCLFVVADGLGGLSRGEVASRLAVETALARYDLERKAGWWLKDAVVEANHAVYSANLPAPADSIATTVTLSLLSPKLLRVANVGDCRLYRLREASFEPLTTDHSESRHVLSRALGTRPSVETDYFELPARSEDRYLQCSDGLYATMSDGEIAAILASADSATCCRELVALANRRGGPDNITVQVFIGTEAE